MRSLVALVGLVAALLPAPPAVRAQEGRHPELTDARIVQLVGTVAINRYAHLAARATLDTTTNPIRLELPATAPWPQFRDGLSRMMRFRPFTEADSSTLLLYVEQVHSRGDSLWATIHWGSARNCRPGWAEDRQASRVTWVRKAPDYWPVVSDHTFLYSESFGRCPKELIGEQGEP